MNPPATPSQRCYILVLNYNGWADTIELLESLYRLNYPSFQVVVIDNQSTDGSVDYIRAWAEGRLDTWTKPSNILRCLTWPPVPKPISYQCLDRTEVWEHSGGLNTVRPGSAEGSPVHPMIIINSGANRFYAGGNNVGLDFVQAAGDFDYVWILNNDTVVHSESLTHLIREMEENPRAGLAGSTLLYYHRPEIIQAQGGAYNRWLGLSRHLKEGHRRPEVLGLLPGAAASSSRVPVSGSEAARDPKPVAGKIAYVPGAAVLVSRSFLRDVGKLNEEYTFYFEEPDWACRAAPRYSLALAPDSLVWHKEGASMGSSSNPLYKSYRADYYGLRSRLIFTRRHYPYALPTVWLGLGLSMVNRIRRRQPDRVKMIFRIMAEELRVWWRRRASLVKS